MQSPRHGDTSFGLRPGCFFDWDGYFKIWHNGLGFLNAFICSATIDYVFFQAVERMMLSSFKTGSLTERGFTALPILRHILHAMATLVGNV